MGALLCYWLSERSIAYSMVYRRATKPNKGIYSGSLVHVHWTGTVTRDPCQFASHSILPVYQWVIFCWNAHTKSQLRIKSHNAVFSRWLVHSAIFSWLHHLEQKIFSFINIFKMLLTSKSNFFLLYCGYWVWICALCQLPLQRCMQALLIAL